MIFNKSGAFIDLTCTYEAKNDWLFSDQTRIVFTICISQLSTSHFIFQGLTVLSMIRGMSVPCALARNTRQLLLNHGIRCISNPRPGYESGSRRSVTTYQAAVAAPTQSDKGSSSTDSTHKFSFPPEFDVVVVGGGIVGSATARQLKIEHPNLRICMLEKESKLAAHQSGNNSGVIHAGIYYTPGSLRAKLCVEGIDLAYEFLRENKVPHKKIGKLIVAVDQEEIPRLEVLYERAKKNGCKNIEMVDGKRIQEIQPHCRGLKALWSPHTGIVDWGEVTRAFAADFEKRGGTAFVNYEVKNITKSTHPKYPIALRSGWENSVILTKYLVTCGGLHSDRIAQMTGCSVSPKIVPFRGEYLLLKSSKKDLIKTNIYPVPDPSLPFLGVHFTPRMNGDVWMGPNAVLAYKREGYSYFSISPKDLSEALLYSGMRKLMTKHFKYGMSELYRGIFIGAQVKRLQKFIPELRRSDAKRGPSGVRAQAMDDDGNLVDDFVFDSGSGELSKRVLHVRNAPSPGATSSMAIAKMIAKEVHTRFGI
ncbi:unnamed protein product [Cylicocyclus nassatus]|uniref:L-2-hydroxyglutarate dehydrogenase, mitochondrial n=1 Tax=Cylicocyclus nassatus TaxID=53992 RepID=A0AA36DPL4_CYLNA|nr:unnamed protein product [Cylicocyclus nassatus]